MCAYSPVVTYLKKNQSIPIEHSDLCIIYFTDVHFGLNPAFRTDNHYEKIMKKLKHIFSVAKTIESYTDTFLVCGGDLLDVPKIINSEERGKGIIPYQLIEIMSLFQENKVNLVCGNHDIEHGTDFDREVGRSPIIFFPLAQPRSGIMSIDFKHWRPDYSDFKLSQSIGSKILFTHEALVKEKNPQFGKSMWDVSDKVDYVFTADIHSHQGVNLINDKVFISPGAVTRTHSGEKDKIPKFCVAFFDYSKKGRELTHVYFQDLLEIDDNRDEYWIDARETKVSNDVNEFIGEVSIKAIEDQLKTQLDSVNVEEILQKSWKNSGGTEEEYEFVKI